MRYPLGTFHKPIVLSKEPEAKYSPSPENDTLDTGAECPVKVFISSQLDTLHNRIVPSIDPNAKYFQSPENTTLNT